MSQDRASSRKETDWMHAPETTHPGKYRIGVVSRITGISQHALRVWERRYGTFGPSRSEAGGRLYTDEEIARLVVIRKLLDRGHSIGRLSKLPMEELERILGAYQPDPSPQFPASDLTEIRRRFLSSVNLLDLPQAEQILQRAATTLNARTLVVELIAPIVEEVGLRWERGDFRVFHEHAATALLRNLIATQLKAYSPATNATAAVIATPSGEQHEFGALIVSMLIATRGWRAVYLGTSLPAADILAAAVSSRAKYILLSVADCRENELSAELAAVQKGLPEGVELVVGGSGSPRYREVLVGSTLTSSVDEFEAWLNRH